MPPPPSYPTIPSGPSAPLPRTRLGVARSTVVALLAALLGGLLGGTVAVRMAGDDEAAVPQAQPVQAPPVPASDSTAMAAPVEEVAEALLPSVVQIDIDGGSEGLSVPGRGGGNGSGVVYRSDGYIITNNHVVAEADDLQVVFDDGITAQAQVIGRDPLSDLAVLRVQRDGLPAVRIGDSSQLRVGQQAVAIGSPFGLDGSVTAGIVSAVERPIEVPGGILPSVVQTDAPINPGNSGGPLVAADGSLIGINSAILTAGSAANAGVGFAIPSNRVVEVAETLIADGEVIYAYLGVAGQDASAEDDGAPAGATVTQVLPGAPAADAGLREGDVITAFDGEDVRSFPDLLLAVQEAQIGTTLPLEYRRDGEPTTVDVTLVERPE